MASSQPFTAYQYALLHVLNILAHAKTDEIHAATSASSEQAPTYLVLPEELLFQAYCFLTEQIHEVAKPSQRLSQLKEKLEGLNYRVGDTDNGTDSTSQFAALRLGSSNGSGTRRSSRLSPTKRSSLSPTTARVVRTTPSKSSNGVYDSLLTMDEGTPPLPGGIGIPATPASPTRLEDPSKLLAQKVFITISKEIERTYQEGAETIMDAVYEFRSLLGDLDNPNNSSFLDRSSPLGMWLRRAILTLNKMSFDDIQILLHDIREFGRTEARLEQMPSATSDISSPQSTLPYREETFEAYIRALHGADYSGALTYLHRFFDYETGPFAGGSSNNRGMRQYALLNLATFHLDHKEYQSARLACSEGLKISRSAGDLICLNAFTSVLRRINFDDTEAPMHDDEFGTAEGNGHLAGYDAREDPGGYVPPMDQLWDVKYGLASRVPVPALSTNLYRAKALHYFSLTQKTNLSSKERRKEKKLAASQGKDAAASVLDSQQRKSKWNRLDLVAWHETSAQIWEKLGSHTLAETYRTVARLLSSRTAQLPSTVDFDPYGGSRLAVIASTATQLARQGCYDTAICLLLSEADMPLTVRDVDRWQQAIYGVVEIQARRLNYDTVLQHVQHTYKHHGDFAVNTENSEDEARETPRTRARALSEPREYSGLLGEIEALLRKCEDYLSIDEAAPAYPLAMKAITFSSPGDGQHFVVLNRRAHLVVARVLNALKAPDQAIKVIDEIYADVLGSDDAEFIAQTKKIKAECLVALLDELVEEKNACVEETREAILEEAAGLSRDACGLYRSLACRTELLDGLTLSMAIHRRQGDEAACEIVTQELQSIEVGGILPGSICEKDLLERLCSIERICAAVSGQIAASF